MAWKEEEEEEEKEKEEELPPFSRDFLNKILSKSMLSMLSTLINDVASFLE